jgi:hypothetical protein
LTKRPGQEQTDSIGAFAEHSADAHTPVDGLAEAAIPRTSHHYLADPSKAKGAAKALLYSDLVTLDFSDLVDFDF